MVSPDEQNYKNLGKDTRAKTTLYMLTLLLEEGEPMRSALPGSGPTGIVGTWQRCLLKFLWIILGVLVPTDQVLPGGRIQSPLLWAK